jgi:hypothetical protein
MAIALGARTTGARMWRPCWCSGGTALVLLMRLPDRSERRCCRRGVWLSPPLPPRADPDSPSATVTAVRAFRGETERPFPSTHMRATHRATGVAARTCQSKEIAASLRMIHTGEDVSAGRLNGLCKCEHAAFSPTGSASSMPG